MQPITYARHRIPLDIIRHVTMPSNAIRGYAAEFGITAARGMAHIDPLLESRQDNDAASNIRVRHLYPP